MICYICFVYTLYALLNKQKNDLIEKLDYSHFYLWVKLLLQIAVFATLI